MAEWEPWVAAKVYGWETLIGYEYQVVNGNKIFDPLTAAQMPAALLNELGNSAAGTLSWADINLLPATMQSAIYGIKRTYEKKPNYQMAVTYSVTQADGAVEYNIQVNYSYTTALNLVGMTNKTDDPPATLLPTIKNPAEIYMVGLNGINDGGGSNGGGFRVGNYVISAPDDGAVVHWYKIDDIPYFYNWRTRTATGNKTAAYALVNTSLPPPVHWGTNGGHAWSNNFSPFLPGKGGVVDSGSAPADASGPIRIVGWGNDTFDVIGVSSLNPGDSPQYADFHQRLTLDTPFFLYFDPDRANAGKPRWDPRSPDPVINDFNQTQHPRYIFSIERGNVGSTDWDFNDVVVSLYVGPANDWNKNTSDILVKAAPGAAFKAWFKASDTKTIRVVVPAH